MSLCWGGGDFHPPVLMGWRCSKGDGASLHQPDSPRGCGGWEFPWLAVGGRGCVPTLLGGVQCDPEHCIGWLSAVRVPARLLSQDFLLLPWLSAFPCSVRTLQIYGGYIMHLYMPVSAVVSFLCCILKVITVSVEAIIETRPSDRKLSSNSRPNSVHGISGFLTALFLSDLPPWVLKRANRTQSLCCPQSSTGREVCIPGPGHRERGSSR